MQQKINVNIAVLDNVIPKKLLCEYNNLRLPTYRSRSDDQESIYSTFVEYGDDYVEGNELILDHFVHSQAQSIWDWFAQTTHLTISNLNSCYVNVMSYGDEGYAHIDATEDLRCVTCIIYLNEVWHSQWGGETAFYSGNYIENFNDDWYYTHEIMRSVLPRYGRIVLFDGHIPHSVRPLSKKCLMQRKSFMLKLNNVNFNEITNAITKR